jgi:hypothetical protein
VDARIRAAERGQLLALLERAHAGGVLALDEYDARIAAVSAATHASDLRRQVADLPSAYAWEAEPAAPGGRIALILGIASVPLSLCAVGGVLGLLAVIASRGGTVRGRVTAALLGRIFGMLGVALSIMVVIAVRYVHLGP